MTVGNVPVGPGRKEQYWVAPVQLEQVGMSTQPKPSQNWLAVQEEQASKMH